MMKNIGKITLIILGIAILSGCSILGEKKEEIKINQYNETKPAESEAITSENENTEEQSSQEEIKTKTENLDQVSKKSSEPLKEDEVESQPKEVESIVPAFKINKKLVSWGYASSSDRKIDTIIVHSSYNSLSGDEHSLEKVLDIYKSYGVSPHYIITREGKIYQLVEDKNIAYHAGVSKVPDGRENVNNFSVGIEIINTKSESPSSEEYSSLKKLISYLKDKYKIKYTLGHKDIAPGRKDDPWNFDWKKVK